MDTPAGWYADPWDERQQRYWDGNEWTGHTHVPKSAVNEIVPLNDASTRPAVDRFDDLIIGRIGQKTLAEIQRSCRDGERPRFIVAEGQAGALAAFDDRCMIVKKGALTSLMAGSLGGGRVTTFMYGEITGIEYNSGFVNGVLEILTASYQGSANKDFWRGTHRSRNANANDPWTLSNCLPLSKPLYEQARDRIDELKRLIADAKRPVVNVAAPAPSQGNLATQIAELAELHRSGALDDAEFAQAKRTLLQGASVPA